VGGEIQYYNHLLSLTMLKKTFLVQIMYNYESAHWAIAFLWH
jgi:hypothetical protein